MTAGTGVSWLPGLRLGADAAFWAGLGRVERSAGLGEGTGVRWVTGGGLSGLASFKELPWCAALVCSEIGVSIAFRLGWWSACGWL